MIPLWLQILGVAVGIIGSLVGAISLVRTIRINRRLNDEPYFKNMLTDIEKSLSSIIKEFACHSSGVNEYINKDISNIFKDAQRLHFDKNSLNGIRNFLDKYNYTQKYDRKFQKRILQIYNNGTKLQSAIQNFNSLILPIIGKDEVLRFILSDGMGKRDDKLVESVKKTAQKYLKHEPEPNADEELKNNKRYRRDLRKVKEKILKLSNSIKRDAARFDNKLAFYSLKFGSSPNTV